MSSMQKFVSKIFSHFFIEVTFSELKFEDGFSGSVEKLFVRLFGLDPFLPDQLEVQLEVLLRFIKLVEKFGLTIAKTVFKRNLKLFHYTDSHKYFLSMSGDVMNYLIPPC